jgi:hypothetical protein
VRITGKPVSAVVKAAIDFLENLDTLIVKEKSCQNKDGIQMKSSNTGNGCLEDFTHKRS